MLAKSNEPRSKCITWYNVKWCLLSWVIFICCSWERTCGEYETVLYKNIVLLTILILLLVTKSDKTCGDSTAFYVLCEVFSPEEYSYGARHQIIQALWLPNPWHLIRHFQFLVQIEWNFNVWCISSFLACFGHLNNSKNFDWVLLQSLTLKLILFIWNIVSNQKQSSCTWYRRL